MCISTAATSAGSAIITTTATATTTQAAQTTARAGASTTTQTRHLFGDLIESILEQLSVLSLCLFVGVRFNYGFVVFAYERLDLAVQLIVIIDHTKDEIVTAVLNVEVFDDVLA